MNEFLTNLRREAEANPIVALGVAAGVLTALSKLVDSANNHRNAIAWDKEVNRRVRNTQK